MIPAYEEYIRYSLDNNSPLPKDFSEKEWKDFFSFCCLQSIQGVVFAGLEKANRPVPQQILLEWFALEEKAKKMNLLINERVLAISRWFKERGRRSVILKGQANALMYPNPVLRSPGDIDIWVEGDSKSTIKLVKEICPKAHYSIHHIKMPVYNDVSIEVHYKPIYLINWFLDKKLQKYIKSVEYEQFEHRVLLNGEEIGSLTDDFNAVYQLLHMYAHFFSTRNNFKQLIDYYYLLKRGFSEDQKIQIAALLKEFKVWKYAQGIMWIMHNTLGLDRSLLILTPSENVGKVILRESMYTGSFSNNKFLYVIQRFIANIRLALLFPNQVVISPMFLFWHQWWKLKMKFCLRRL